MARDFCAGNTIERRCVHSAVLGMEREMRCILCGGDHEPHPARCDDEGIDREIARMGARRWNQLANQAQRQANKEIIAALRRMALIRSDCDGRM